MQLKIDEIRAEKIIPADDSVRLLGEIMEEMDYTPLLRAYKRTGRRPATNPVTMLKIVVYAIMEGIFSSRAIASACKRDINFIWLLNGENAPNHSEIARFRSKRLTECGEELFYQTIEKLSELGEIKYEHLFVDGTKIEANANKYSQSSARKRKRTLSGCMARFCGSGTSYQRLTISPVMRFCRRGIFKTSRAFTLTRKHIRLCDPLG